MANLDKQSYKCITKRNKTVDSTLFVSPSTKTNKSGCSTTIPAECITESLIRQQAKHSDQLEQTCRDIPEAATKILSSSSNASRSSTTNRYSGIIKRFSSQHKESDIPKPRSVLKKPEVEPSSTCDNEINQKVLVTHLNLTGTVRYIGEIGLKRKKGQWIGIELDIKGRGKNNGCLQGTRYFTCAANTGLFVPSTKVARIDSDINRPITKPLVTFNKLDSESFKRKSMYTSSVMISNDDNNRSSNIPTDKHKLTKPTRTQSVKRSGNQSPHTLESNSSQPKKISTQKSSTSVHRRTLSSTSTARLSKQPPMRKSSSLCTKRVHDVTAACNTKTQQQRRHNNKQWLQSSVSSKTEAELDELKRMQVLLEQSREEKKALSEKIDTKEAAWERLLTAKESYALRVQEKDSEIARLNATLEKTHDAAEQLNDVIKERDTALSRLSMLNDTEKELSKTIERLGGHIQCLQQQNSDQANSHEMVLRSHASQMEQLRKQLIERDQTVTTVERECTDLRLMNAGIISAYESKIAQLTKDNELAMIERELHIDKLQQVVNNLHQIYPASNTSFVMDVEEEADTNIPTPQKQLEYQLELTTYELECEREQVKSMALDIDQLKEEIKRLHRLSATTDSEFYALRGQLEEEIVDKRRIMEEANATMENQTKVEEEKESLRITLIKTQFELAETLKKIAVNEKHRTKTDEIHWLIEKKRLLEVENEATSSSHLKLQDKCQQLKDKLTLYEHKSKKDQNCNTKEHVCQEKIRMLELQIAQEARRHRNLECSKQLKIDTLSREIKELETLIENKVFKESELEGLIEEKEMSIKILNIRLESEEEKNLKQSFGNSRSHSYSIPPLSPTSPQHFFIDQKRKPFHSTPSDSSESISNHGNLEEDVYCEICEEYGHEVITCRAVTIYDVLEKEENFITNAQLSAARSSFYCVNCDVFGEHPSEDCPNQDETF